MTWNHKELQENIENLFGKKQQELLSPCLKTIDTKKFNATYHYEEVERLINEELKKIASDNAKLLEISYNEDSEEFKNAKLVLKKAGAHIIACLQSLHSLADVLAHAIYFALNMNNDPKTKIKARKVSFSSLLQRLDLVVGAGQIKIKFDYLRTDGEFSYLSDIVNCSKHRNLIRTNFWINLDQNKEYSAECLEFHRFEFNGDTHAQRRIVEFIKNEYSRIDALAIEIGIEINKFVKNKLMLNRP